MRDVFAELARQAPRLERGFLLMLDFDGVLAPIEAHPDTARMSVKTRTLVAACARRSVVAVISGRALADVRRRVRIPGIWYAGNHGNEWEMGYVRGRTSLSKKERAALRAARGAFEKLSRRHPGVIIENKTRTFSVHFRHVAHRRIAVFKRESRDVTKQFRRSLNLAEGSEYVYNVRPRYARTKGDAVRLAQRHASKGAVPIFIGDDTTDEDAFRALPRGITIRVGKHRGSYARFFINTRADVDTILAILARF